MPSSKAILFVGNIIPEADAKMISRLFNTYGNVIECDIAPSSGTTPSYALVTFAHPDDADCAIAALHLRYCMAPRVPIYVLYHKSSGVVSEYGRCVFEAFRQASTTGTPPLPVPLETFDVTFARANVPPPPTDFQLPVVPVAFQAMQSQY